MNRHDLGPLAPFRLPDETLFFALAKVPSMKAALGAGEVHAVEYDGHRNFDHSPRFGGYEMASKNFLIGA